MSDMRARADAELREWWAGLSWRERWWHHHCGKVWKWGARLGLFRVRKDGNEGWVWKRKPTAYTADNLIRELRLGCDR